MSSVSTLNPPPSAATATKSLRIGVLAAIGTLDPRDSGDTITGLMLGQVFEMAYSMTEAGTLEPCLFAEFLRKDRDGVQPVYSAAVRKGIFFSDGTELTAEIAATSLANAGALRGRATVSARDGRVIFTMSGPSPRFENVICQWNTGIVLDRQGTFYGTGPYRLAAGTTIQSMQRLRDWRGWRRIRSIAGKWSATSCSSSFNRPTPTARRGV